MSALRDKLLEYKAFQEEQRERQKVLAERENRNAQAILAKVKKHIRPAKMEEYKTWLETRAINFGLPKNICFTEKHDQISIAIDNFFLPELYAHELST